jgi:hypothetical protein
MSLFLLHASLMGTGFLLALSALFIAMTQRRKRWWLRVHRPLGLAGTVTMLLGAAAAVAAVTALPKPAHFASPHTWVGGLTVVLAAGASTLGFLQFRIPAKAADFRAFHRLVGRLVDLIAPIAILMGLRAAEII